MNSVVKNLATLLFLFASMNVIAASQTEANKQTVIDYFRTALDEKNPDKAAELYGGEYYVQHNPLVRDGWDGFRSYIRNYVKLYPDMKVRIVRLIAEGDFVVAHVHTTLSKQDTRGVAAIDIFRLEQGKIVEHWDVIQPIPEESENPNSMF
ncbi:MAG: polyketide cyclase [Gammaproteobacteria bacterium]|nr:polyketide cyclase [Gammaproteobacteria bacterium]